jgi:hypothetical protein
VRRLAALSWYVHITRAVRWTEGEQHPIPREEWLAYVEADEELRRVTAAEVEANKPFVKADDAAWIEQRGDGTDKVLAWFGYHKGLIDVRNPHAETLQKMADIAERLKANVVDEEDSLLVDPGPPQPTWRKPASPRRSSNAPGAPLLGIVAAVVVVAGLAALVWLLLHR